MRVTDIPNAKAPPDDRNDDCLHCMLMNAVEDWHRSHGKTTPDGQQIIDLTVVIAKLAECMVEFTQAAGSRHDRRRAFRYAHDTLDAALKSSQTGKLIEVDVPAEH